MEVILREDVEDLGRKGQVVKVTPGYARTFLLPRKLATAATEANKKIVEQERHAHLRREAKLASEASELGRLLDGTEITVSATSGMDGQLFGSITAQDISDALLRAGYVIEPRKIRLNEPIRSLGDHQISIRLQREVTVKAMLHVAAQEEIALRKEAVRVFGEATAAEEWLNEPAPSLGDRKPVELIRGSKEDRDRVYVVLGRIEHGIF